MGFVWVGFFFLILCLLGMLMWWLFWGDLKINHLVFIATPSKTQALTNTMTLETGFGARFKCWVFGLTGLRHMTFSDEKRINIFFFFIFINWLNRYWTWSCTAQRQPELGWSVRSLSSRGQRSRASRSSAAVGPWSPGAATERLLVITRKDHYLIGNAHQSKSSGVIGHRGRCSLWSTECRFLFLSDFFGTFKTDPGQIRSKNWSLSNSVERAQTLRPGDASSNPACCPSRLCGLRQASNSWPPFFSRAIAKSSLSWNSAD